MIRVEGSRRRARRAADSVPVIRMGSRIGGHASFLALAPKGETEREHARLPGYISLFFFLSSGVQGSLALWCVRVTNVGVHFSQGSLGIASVCSCDGAFLFLKAKCARPPGALACVCACQPPRANLRFQECLILLSLWRAPPPAP